MSSMDAGSRKAVDATGEATLELFRENDAYNEFLWRSLSALSFRPCAGRVLEIGCGIGNLTRIILRSPAVEHLHGIDRDPTYVERLRGELPDPRLELSVALAEEFCPERNCSPGGGFDVIVASNVLEHIEDDARVLRNFRRMLRHGGAAWILVPAHPFLYCSLDRRLSHHRRYRRRDVEELARASDLRVARMRHFNPLGTLGWWLNGVVLRRKILPGRQVSFYSRFGIPVSAWIDRWSPLPLGVSLLAVLSLRQDSAGNDPEWG